MAELNPPVEVPVKAKGKILSSIENEFASRKYRAFLSMVGGFLTSQFVVINNLWVFLVAASVYILGVSGEDIGKWLGNKTTSTSINLAPTTGTESTVATVRSRRTSIDPMGAVSTDNVDTKVEVV